jgi:tight adherence protein B
MTSMILAGIVLVAGIETNFILSSVLLVFLLIGLRLWLWHSATRQQSRIVTQLPEFLDGVVRMITIGNSVPAAFQAAVPAVDLPLRACLERASRMMRAGVELDKALNNLADLYVIEEFTLIASVVRLSVRYGGRADQVLERMAAFMRDREMAQRELSALSAETRLSAWILGLLPVVVGTFIVLSNPQYFIGMWFDPTGRHLFYGALGLQLVGIFLLYRLAKL